MLCATEMSEMFEAGLMENHGFSPIKNYTVKIN